MVDSNNKARSSPWHLLVRPDLWVGLALLILTAATFSRVCTCSLVNFDDPGYVLNNMYVQNGISNFQEVQWAFVNGEYSNWHPLTWMSLMLDTDLYHGKDWGYHLTNLILHTLNVVLLYTLLVKLTGQWPPSALVAALFAVHPLHVESVAWVSERKDVLSTFFGFLTLLAYIRYVRRPEMGRGLLVLAAYTASLMAKPTLVTMPCLLLLLDFWPLRRTRPIKNLLIEKLPMFILAAASCVITLCVQHQGGAVKSLEVFSPAVRVSNAIETVVAYLAQMLWPVNLCNYYPHPIAVASTFRLTLEVLFLLTVTVGACLQVRKRPYLLVGWLWYLGTLVPVVGLVQVGHQARADRYTYIPLIGIFVALVWSLWEALPTRLRGLGLALVSLPVLSLCVAMTWHQIGYWKNSQALWEHTLALTSDNTLAVVMYSDALEKEGRADLAEEYLRDALRANREKETTLDALARMCKRQGRLHDALNFYRQAAAIRPDSHWYRTMVEGLESEIALRQ